ncbi:hypothetical protein LIER_18466 [Lithospermum erythrorhizon]|uniref:Uncharacterized protein n=1 Tax=Lithospermum erythrorhizon TaxID=34254 RepID=A0AAV3QGG5_LITER
MHLERIQDKLYAGSLDVNTLIEERNAKDMHRRLSQAEKMLLQAKSRNTWLELGDANNRFFHSSLISRQSRNKLCTIKDGRATKYIHGKIPEQCIHALLAQPTRNEVKQAMSSMKKEKCPDPDGLFVDFYQKNWNCVG